MNLHDDHANRGGYSIIIDQTVQFFLNLYLLQLDISYTETHRVKARAIPLPPGRSGSDAAYELRVVHGNQRKTRRMTIGLIGGSHGSKSTCLKVTYDDLLVVKIPPHPITDFGQYLKNISLEQRIANRLKPEIKCITPSVSAILKRIPRFYEREDLDPDTLEKRYLARLEKFPRLQKHLMIGDSFAFFMNLSKHLFVGSVIRKLHDVETAMQDEIASNTDALLSLEAFHERYGMENTPSFFNVNEVLTACDTAVGPLIEQYEIATRLPAYIRKKWLLNHLADLPIEKGGVNLPEPFYDELQETLQEVLIARKEAVDSFLDTVREYIHRKRLEQNISHFKALIINLLEILARLKNNQIAIRDLKPDNVFVVSITPQSLPDPSSSNAYALGLIDFETSVNLAPREPSEIKQPKLAGTPYYATPASIFENRILILVYQNLHLVYRLQDWYSTMAMLYEIVVGEHLFEETGRMLPKIVRIKQKNLRAGIHPNKIYIHVNRLFWKTAETEFRQKLEEHRKHLDKIRPVLPGMVADMLVNECRICSDLVKKAIDRRIGTQRMFDGSESRNILYKASSEGIRRYRRKWALNHGKAPAGGKVRKRIIHFLEQLESDKTMLENLERMRDSLTHMPLKRSVGDLLEVMYQLISGCLGRIPG